MPSIRIPTPLRLYAGNQTIVTVTGNTVGTALNSLIQQYPDLYQHLYNGADLRSFVNIFLNQEDVRFLQGTETEVTERDMLLIVPSIAGGSCL